MRGEARHVEADRGKRSGEQDEAADQDLEEGVDLDVVETIVDHAQHQKPDDGVADAAAPAEAAAPAAEAPKAARTPAEPIVTSLQITSIEHRNSEAAGDYAYMKGSIVDAAGETREVTAMAFSQAYELLRDELVDGATVSVTAQFGRGAVRIVGGADGVVVNVAPAATTEG